MLPFSDFDSGQSYISFMTHREEAILSTYRVALGLNKMNEIILPIHPRHFINSHWFIQMLRRCLTFKVGTLRMNGTSQRQVGVGKAPVPGTMEDLPDKGRGGRRAQGQIRLKPQRRPTPSRSLEGPR